MSESAPAVDPKTLAIGAAVVVAGVGAYMLLGSSKPPVVLTPDEQKKLDAALQAAKDAERKNEVDQRQYDANKAALQTIYDNPANPLAGTGVDKVMGATAAWLDWQIQGDAKPDLTVVPRMDALVKSAYDLVAQGKPYDARDKINEAKDIRSKYWHSFSQYAVIDRIDPSLQPADARLAVAEKAVNDAIDTDMTQQFVRKTVSQALQNRNLVARLSPEARKLFDTIAPTYDQYVANKNSDDMYVRATIRQALLKLPGWFTSNPEIKDYIDRTASAAEAANRAVLSSASAAASTIRTVGAGLEHLLSQNAINIMVDQYFRWTPAQQKQYYDGLTPDQQKLFRNQIRQAKMNRS